MKLYVGNLSFDTTEQDLSALFEPFGSVNSVAVITDRETGRSRGFGFVEMAEKSDAEAAMNELNGKNVDGRDLTVNEAREKSSSGGGGNRGRGGGGKRW